VVIVVISACCGLQQQLPVMLGAKGFTAGQVSVMISATTVFLALGKFGQGLLYGKIGVEKGGLLTMAAFAAGSAAKVVGSGKVLTQIKHPLMGSDNFSCYLEQTPGAYLFLSSSNPEKGTDVDHHNCRFEIDEDVLWEGTAVFAQIAVDFA
jgi:hypothetical protein